MSDRCQTCAFRVGTEAHGTEHTRMMADLCVQSGRTFFCHEDHEPCRGWKAEVCAGGLEPVRWRRDVYGVLADVLADTVSDLAVGKSVSDGEFARMITESLHALDAKHGASR